MKESLDGVRMVQLTTLEKTKELGEDEDLNTGAADAGGTDEDEDEDEEEERLNTGGEVMVKADILRWVVG